MRIMIITVTDCYRRFGIHHYKMQPERHPAFVIVLIALIRLCFDALISLLLMYRKES